MEKWKERSIGALRELESERDTLKDKAARLTDELKASQEELETAREELGKQGKRCRACGNELACPNCYRAGDLEDY